MSKRIVVYPGSFDPITLGHADIIDRLKEKFDEVVVLISSSTQKKYLFDLKKRFELVSLVCKDIPNTRVDSWDGLLVDYLKKNNLNVIVKGLRNTRDFEYEITMDHTNKVLFPDIETVYLISRPEFSFVSSTLVKEISVLKGDLSQFVPEVVSRALKS